MAECAEEDMEEEPPLRQELTCSVCRGIFVDPVVLVPCSHSFCRGCLQRCPGRTCPLCRGSFSEGQVIPNRALGEACRVFARLPCPRPAAEGGCRLHLQPLLLYCEKDEQPICVHCVPLHDAHKLRPVDQAVAICKRELETKVQIFENKVESYKKLTQNLDSTMEHIKNQAKEAEKQIRLEFERLHNKLHEEEHRRLSALAAEEEQKITSVQKLVRNIKHDISGLRKLIDSVKKEMGNEDLPLLQNFQELKQKAQWNDEDRCHSVDSLLNVGKHLGALSFNIWKSLQDHVIYNPVVFDPNTSSPHLSVSADLTAVKESSELLPLPANAERFNPCTFVLGAEGYTSGKHRWDVNVGNSPSWIVGVCKESVARKKKFTLSPNRGVWCIGLSKGMCTIFTNERTVLEVEQRPELIRIKLNMDRGEVSFWDGENAKHLVTLKHNFQDKIFPFFGPGLNDTPMILAPRKLTLHTT